MSKPEDVEYPFVCDSSLMSSSLNWSQVNSKPIVLIDADGVLRVQVEADDQNAADFVAAIERHLGRRLTGVEAVEKTA